MEVCGKTRTETHFQSSSLIFIGEDLGEILLVFGAESRGGQKGGGAGSSKDAAKPPPARKQPAKQQAEPPRYENPKSAGERGQTEVHPP